MSQITNQTALLLKSIPPAPYVARVSPNLGIEACYISKIPINFKNKLEYIIDNESTWTTIKAILSKAGLVHYENNKKILIDDVVHELALPLILTIPLTKSKGYSTVAVRSLDNPIPRPESVFFENLVVITDANSLTQRPNITPPILTNPRFYINGVSMESPCPSCPLMKSSGFCLYKTTEYECFFTQDTKPQSITENSKYLSALISIFGDATTELLFDKTPKDIDAMYLKAVNYAIDNKLDF